MNTCLSLMSLFWLVLNSAPLLFPAHAADSKVVDPNKSGGATSSKDVDPNKPGGTGRSKQVDPNKPGGTAYAPPEMELKATVLSKGEKDIKVKTKDDEKIILIGNKTKGIENAKEGTKVTIKYSEKDGQLKASEINPR